MISSKAKITFLIPCLNEEESLPFVIDEIQKNFNVNEYDYEILISDNGSTDNSKNIAIEKSARVIEVKERGYGSALRAGISNAEGKYVVMGDADGSYSFAESKQMIVRLEQGFDLVMGDRFAGHIYPGAMPWLHKYLGNPVLSFLGRLFFRLPIRDFHCGLRAFDRDKIISLGLQSSGMEYASEMIVVSKKNGLNITEVPVTLKPDLRSRAPHLRTWHDGWRHLRFLLSHSPLWLFMVPSILSFTFALISGVLSIIGPINSNGVSFSYRTSLISTSLALVSLIATWYFLIAKEILQEFPPKITERISKSLPIFVAIFLLGSSILIRQFSNWWGSGFQIQPLGRDLLVLIWGSFLTLMGFLSSLSIFLIGILKVRP